MTTYCPDCKYERNHKIEQQIWSEIIDGKIIQHKYCPVCNPLDDGEE